MPDTSTALPPVVTSDKFEASSLNAAKESKEAGDKIQTNWDAERAPVAAAVKTAGDDLSQAVDKPAATVPVPTDKPKHPDPKQLQDTASSMMALAGLAGLLTRRPMTAALNNMTAAMEGVKEGSDEKYKKEYAEFQTNYKEALAQNKAALDEKEKVLKDRNLSLTAKESQLRLIDTKYGNDISRNEKSYKDKMGLIDAQRKAQEHAEGALEKMNEFHERQQLARESLDLRREALADRREHAAAEKTGTLSYKLGELDKLRDSKTITEDDYNTRKKILIEGSSHPTMAEDRAAAQRITLKKSNDELEHLAKTAMPLAADIHVDGDGVVSAVGRLGQKKALSAEQQQLVTAAQLFAESAGHLQAGARITKDAFARTVREFIPQPGDKPETLAMKKEHRDAIVSGSDVMAGRAGKAMDQANAARATGKPTAAPATTNAKGWVLHTDKNGAKAYVSPDGKQFEEAH